MRDLTLFINGQHARDLAAPGELLKPVHEYCSAPNRGANLGGE
jgi:hypothetical protein